MSSVAWLGRALVAFSSAVGLGACSTSAGGPGFVTLGIDAEPSTAMFGGTGGPGAGPMQLCARMPVLLGSSVEKAESLSGLDVRVAATRDVANVTFPAAANSGTSRTYSLAELRYGVAESVTVRANGAVFDAFIASLCTNP